MLYCRTKNFFIFQEKKSHRWTEFRPKSDFKADHKKYQCSWQSFVPLALVLHLWGLKKAKRSFCPDILPLNHTHSTTVRKETYLFHASHLELQYSDQNWSDVTFITTCSFKTHLINKLFIFHLTVSANWAENCCFTISLSHLLTPTQDKSAKGWLTKYPKL